MKVPVVMIIAASSMSIGATAASAQTTNPGLLGNGNVPLQSVQPNTGGQGLGYSQPSVGASPGDTSPFLLPGSSTSGVSSSGAGSVPPSSSGVSGSPPSL